MLLFLIGLITRTPDESPYSFELPAGNALMMVSWIGTVIEISIPEYPNTNATTRYAIVDDRYTYFCFKYNATITLYFYNVVTYYVSAPVHLTVSSQIITNTESFSKGFDYYSNTKVMLDLPYYSRIRVKISTLEKGKFFYYSTALYYSEDGKIDTDRYNDPLSSSEVFEVKEDAHFICGPMTYGGRWHSMQVSAVNLLSDVSYGKMNPSIGLTVVSPVIYENSTYRLAENITGRSSTDHVINTTFLKLSEVPTHIVELNFSRELLDNSKIYYNFGSGNSRISRNTTLTHKSPFTPDLNIDFGNCSLYTFRKLNVTTIGFSSLTFDIFDIPEECGPRFCNITAGPEFHNLTILYQIDDEINQSFLGNNSVFLFKDKPFNITFYIIYDQCFEYTILKSVTIFQPHIINYINLTIDDMPETCFIEKSYTVQLFHNITAIDYRLTAYGEEIPFGGNITLNYTHPYIVEVLLNSGLCREYVIDTIKPIPNNKTVRIYDDNDVPYMCQFYRIHVSIDLPDQYKIGYKINGYGDFIKIENKYLYLNFYYDPYIDLYVISSPYCTAKIGTYYSSQRYKLIVINMESLPIKCRIPATKTPSKSLLPSDSPYPTPSKTPDATQSPTPSFTPSISNTPQRTQIYDDFVPKPVENTNSNSNSYEINSDGFKTSENDQIEFDISNNKLNTLTFEKGEIKITQKSSFNSEVPLYFVASNKNAKIIIDESVENSNIGVLSNNSPKIELSKNDNTLSLMNNELNGKIFISISNDKNIEKLIFNDVDNRGDFYLDVPKEVSIVSFKSFSVSGISTLKFTNEETGVKLLNLNNKIIKEINNDVQMEIREKIDVFSKSETSLTNVNLLGDLSIHDDSNLEINTLNITSNKSNFQIIFNSGSPYRSKPILVIENIKGLPAKINILSNSKISQLNNYPIIETNDAFSCKNLANLVVLQEGTKDKINAKCLESVKTIYLNSEVKKSKSGLGAGAIAGIVIGCIVGIAIIALVVFFVIKKKKDDTKSEDEDVSSLNLKL